MLFSAAVSALVAATVVSAAPVEKRGSGINDGTILNYALTLEYLERAFYREGVKNYTQYEFIHAGFPDPFYKNLKEIASDEETHVSFLKAALVKAGVTPTNELIYSFPATTPLEFVTLSSILEGVGVSAYLGAAASIANPAYLTVAGSILTIEARHSSYIRAALHESPFPTPFDTPLDFNEVYSLAASFIVGGSSPVTLPFKPFPALPLKGTKSFYEAGKSTVDFSMACANAQKFDSSITKTTPIYAVFFSGLSKLPVQVSVWGEDYTATVPAGVAGQVYVVLSKSNTDFSDAQIIAGPAILEVYPEGSPMPVLPVNC